MGSWLPVRFRYIVFYDVASRKLKQISRKRTSKQEASRNQSGSEGTARISVEVGDATTYLQARHREQHRAMKPRRLIATLLALVGREPPQRRAFRLEVLAAASLLANVLMMQQLFYSAVHGDNLLGNDPRAGPIVRGGEEELRRKTSHAPRAGRIVHNVDRPLPFHFPQNDQGLHELEFVHIPKTGGTSIEIAASRVGIAWGMCKFAKVKNMDSKCKHIIPFQQQIKIHRGQDWQCSWRVSPWHCPPWKYKGGNKFQNVDTFAVVRNPYDRMISEYYYFFAKHDKKRYYENWMYDSFVAPGGIVAPGGAVARDLNDRELMNRWISDAVDAAESEGHCYLGHCVPFYKFVYAKNGTRAVSHVLKMENLSEEFEALMDRYQLPVRLEQHNVRKDNCTLGVEDLSAETIAKINAWAKLDFKWFGYEMLDPK